MTQYSTHRLAKIFIPLFSNFCLTQTCTNIQVVSTIKVIASLLALSVIGDSCSLTSLLYLGFLCAHTLPALYQRYETEVDHLLARGGEYIKKFYEKIDSNVVSKIPRGPVTGVAFKGSDSIQ